MKKNIFILLFFFSHLGSIILPAAVMKINEENNNQNYETSNFLDESNIKQSFNSVFPPEATLNLHDIAKYHEEIIDREIAYKIDMIKYTGIVFFFDLSQIPSMSEFFNEAIAFFAFRSYVISDCYGLGKCIYCKFECPLHESEIRKIMNQLKIKPCSTYYFFNFLQKSIYKNEKPGFFYLDDRGSTTYLTLYLNELGKMLGYTIKD